MKQFRIALLMVCGFTAALNAATAEEMDAQKQKLNNQRVDQQNLDSLRDKKSLENQQWEQKRVDQSQQDKKADDARWNKQHGR